MHGVRPCLEVLEDRCLPAAFSPLTWITVLEQAAVAANGNAAGGVSAPSVEVHDGQSIQAAVDTAAPGTVIFIDPGTYREAVTVDKPDIFLVGLGGPGRVVIANPGGEDNGVMVDAGGSGFALLGVTIEGFHQNGVMLCGVSQFALVKVAGNDDGAYGLYPVSSSNGLILGCSASGNNDSGLYVGQSYNVAVLGNVAHGNVNGIEVENSIGALVQGNVVYDNTVGILLDLLPGLPLPVEAGIAVRKNLVLANNHRNFGSPGDVAAAEPSGIGVLVLGASGTVVADNLVAGHSTLGIGVVSSELLTLLADVPVSGIEPFPIGTRVEGNTLLNPLGIDLFWDGLGSANFWNDNAFQSSFSPIPLPAAHP